MGRKKIMIDFIEDDRKRASTFEKRRIGLFKKASELNRLCGVNITVIIVNKELAYKFSNSADSCFKTCLSEKQEKFEEDFNNESLSEFINKKSLKNSFVIDDNSFEHQPFKEEQNSTVSDDEEDPKFFDVLVNYRLLDEYKKIKPDISPIKENLDIVQTDQIRSAKVNNSSSLTSLNFANNNQSNNQLITKGSIPPINEIRMNFPPTISEVVNIKPECNSYRELVTMSTTNSSYQYNMDNSINSTGNSNWQRYRNQNFSNTHLLVDSSAKCQNPAIYLETPTYEMCSNIGIQHLNNISFNYHDEDGSPPSKKMKQFYDSTDTFRQHPFS